MQNLLDQRFTTSFVTCHIKRANQTILDSGHSPSVLSVFANFKTQLNTHWGMKSIVFTIPIRLMVLLHVREIIKKMWFIKCWSFEKVLTKFVQICTNICIDIIQYQLYKYQYIEEWNMKHIYLWIVLFTILMQ